VRGIDGFGFAVVGSYSGILDWVSTVLISRATAGFGSTELLRAYLPDCVGRHRDSAVVAWICIPGHFRNPPRPALAPALDLSDVELPVEVGQLAAGILEQELSLQEQNGTENVENRTAADPKIHPP